MSYLSVLSRAIRSYAFSQRAVAVFAMCDHCWKQSEAERRGSSVGGEAGSGVRGPVPGRGEEAGNKKSPFAKEEQRGNVNTGSFRMSSGAVHVALAISVGSKSGAGHRDSSVGGEPDWVSGFRCRAAARRRTIKNPPLPKGDKGGMSALDFSGCGTGRAAMGAAFAISAGSKSGAGHRKNPSVRGCCSPGSGGRAP